MCRECAAKARAEWQLPPSTRSAPPARFNRSFRPDYAFAAAVLLLGLAATFGVVVGPPRPPQQTARVDVTPAPIVLAPVAPDASTRPTDRVAAERAPAERTPDRAPSPQIPAVVAEPPRVSHLAPARPIRVVRASAKRPMLALYQPLERSMLEIVRTPETPVAKPIVVAAAWRPWPEAHAFQAP